MFCRTRFAYAKNLYLLRYETNFRLLYQVKMHLKSHHIF
nr:MAG TPA: hypothetical protein [Caudoviricetes sp.]